MSDREWASTERARQHFDDRKAAVTPFEEQYAKKVLAEYYYSVLEEYGTIGFEGEESGFRSPNYKKVV